MNVDSFFTQGYGHDICQDYATHGENEHFVYCIVSDGCSDSPKSDVGARILAEAFSSSLNWNPPPKVSEWQNFGETMKGYVNFCLPTIQQLLRLPDATFDATLLALVYHKAANRLDTIVWGDGIIQCKYKDSEYVNVFEHENGAPYYLSYSLAKDGKEKYEKAFGSNELTVTNFKDGEELGKYKREPHVFSDILTTDLVSISIMSDGVHTYSDSTNERIPLDEVLERVVGYKGYQGSFVERRMKRIKKEDKEQGNHHFDDISVATMSFT